MPHEPPRETPLTFVFTDVEGSTAGWERHGAAFQVALARHDAIIRQFLAFHRGYEVKTAGDAFLVAFPGATQALQFCRDVQRALAAEDWGPTGPLRVRMGVHRGVAHAEAHPVSGRLDFFGSIVNKAARIESAAHGGQIVLSEEVRDAAGEGAVCADAIDLGDHVLRGLEGRHHLWQVGAGVFPPLRTAAPVSNLPARADRFIGRARELDDLTARLRAGDRVLTLLGPGGTGKTRLALRLAAEALREGFLSAWFVDLADAVDLAGVVQATARALDVPVAQDEVAQLGHAIAGRGRTFLVFDNLEQAAGLAATTVGRWVEMAPEAVFLLTSRVPAHLRGEVVLSLDPLPIDDGIALFRDRAPGAVGSQADLCALVTALDGLPLAIELAAARTRVLSVPAILDRLHDRFRLLVSRGGDRPERHSTLRACLDGSWELLPSEVRQSFAAAAVFEGGFDLAAAEAVVGEDALDHLQVLVEHSLVRVDADRTRYHLLSTVAAYAAERLPPEARQAAERRHLLHYAAWGTLEAVERLDAPGGTVRRALLALEVDNLRVAVRRALAREEAPVAALAALAAWEVFALRGPFEVGRALLTEVLAGELSPPLRARALARRADALRFLGRSGEALEDIEAAADLLAGGQDLQRRGEVHGVRGSILRDVGRLAEAEREYLAALDCFRALHSERGEGVILGNLAILAHDQGRSADTRVLLGDALARHRAVGNRRWEGITLAQLGVLARETGALEEGRHHFEAALVCLREVGDRRFEAVALGNLANLLRQAGSVDAATDVNLAALALHRELGNRRGEGLALGNLGLALRDRGLLPEARERLEQSLTVQWSLANRRHIRWSRMLLGSLLTLLGERESARVELDGALAAAVEPADKALPLVHLAWWHSRGDDAPATLATLDGLDGAWVGEPAEQALVGLLRGWAARRLSQEGADERLATARAKVAGAWISPWSELGELLQRTG